MGLTHVSVKVGDPANGRRAEVVRVSSTRARRTPSFPERCFAGWASSRTRDATMSTLGLAIALHGWPLVRSPVTWKRLTGSDLGPPESLARKIQIWEAWSRKHQWRVETPVIPGLEYPT